MSVYISVRLPHTLSPRNDWTYCEESWWERVAFEFFYVEWFYGEFKEGPQTYEKLL